jgi:glycerophosphoryl diester phosphodiesterase
MSTARRPPVFGARPDVIGHRGMGKGTVDGVLENTAAGVRAAVAAGVDWVELDATRTRDDRVVVHHNPTTAEGDFLVDADAATLTAAGLAPLAEVLESLPPEVGLDLDLKPVLEDATRPVERGVAGLALPLLEREIARRRLLVTSFDPAGLLWLRDRLPGVRVGLLTWLDFPMRIAVPTAVHLGFDVVGLHHRSFAPNDLEPGPVHRPVERNVEVAHDAGLEVLAWCPDAAQAAVLMAAGVDALVVNDVPDVLPAVRRLAAGGAYVASPPDPREPTDQKDPRDPHDPGAALPPR